MKQAPLQWHPAFCSSLQIELEGEPLEFRNEYNLTRKPLQIDVLVIKKLSTRTIQKSIGKLFRTHNIVEFKSPGDKLSINDYFKVLGYACIYQANTEKVMEIRPDEITMSFVTNHYPRKMLKWLSRLRPGLNIREDLNVLAEEYKEKQKNPLYSTCMDVILRANRDTYLRESEKEDSIMCQAIVELMYEVYGDKIEAACEKVREETREATREKTRFITIIEIVKKMLKKQKSAEQIAEELDWEGNFIDQICQVIGILPQEATEEDVLMTWKEMFAA